MKTIKTILTVACIIAVTAGVAMAQGKGRGSNGAGQFMAGPGTIVSQLPYEELSQQEKDGLLKMREEEKLARDVYMYLYDLWQNPVFSNISKSEQRHMDAVGAILNKYGLEDPVDGMGPGQFNSPEMQELYSSLTAKGTSSIQDAFLVGATIEDLDIKDLEELMETADNEDVLTVYQNLVKGSRNHLRAFGSRLASLGITYKAQFLTQEEVDAIISSPWERGRVDKDGNPVSGMGKGRNKGHRYGSGAGPNFVDADGDGICDNWNK